MVAHLAAAVLSGTLMVQAQGLPSAGERFGVQVTGAPHVCSAKVGQRKLKSPGCTWLMPRHSAGETLRVTVRGGGQVSRMSWTIDP